MLSASPSVILLVIFLSSGLSRATVGNWDACGGRLERALDALHRDSTRRNRLEEDEAGMSYQHELRSAPLEMAVSQVAVKFPQSARESNAPWARVEKCIYEPSNKSLQTRVMFNDLSVSGMVSLMPRDRHPPIPAESCKMTLRLRRAGIDFFTSPIARGRGQMRIRTESSFLEPRFASIYAYGCHPTRVDKQIKRQDKWPPHYSSGDEFTVLPVSPSDSYDAAEPRQLVAVSKEVDVLIPNEARQSRALNAPLAKLGIWRKNTWVTKLPVRERRSKFSDGKDTLEKNSEARLSIRVSRSAEVITPQDFVTALINKRLENRTDTNRLVAWENTTEGLIQSQHEDCELKTNFKREDNFKSTDQDAPRETRELFVNDDFQNAHLADFTDVNRSWQSKEHIAREMEDVFLRGASQALTRYIERQLHPAIKETLMLSMGYTISYG